MKRVSWIVVLFCVSGAFAQRVWVMPKLHEVPWKQTIGSGKVHLSAAEMVILKRASRKIIAACVKYPGPWDPKTAKGLFEHLRVGRVDIGSAGEKALVVQGNGVCMCGAVGNCPIWLIGVEKQPRLLLGTEGIQMFAIEKPGTNGHFGLVLGTHDSASEFFLQRFQFSRTQYRREGCALLDYANPVGRSYPKPKIAGRLVSRKAWSDSCA